MKRQRLFTILIVLFWSCGQGQSRKGDYIPEEFDYDYMNPTVYKLTTKLQEISGIAFKDGKADYIYAIQDELGIVYKIDLATKKSKKAKFHKKGDYEDISILGDDLVILRSDGELFFYPISEVMEKNDVKVKSLKHLFPKAEYEGLYADNKKNKIYVLCKVCEDKDQYNKGIVYMLDMNHTNPKPVEIIFDITKNQQKKDFRPSALAFNEKTKEWYILSSINLSIVITDENWKVKDVLKLKRTSFYQPEGIAFDEDNNLYISNEGGEYSAANILKYKRINTKSK